MILTALYINVATAMTSNPETDVYTTTINTGCSLLSTLGIKNNYIIIEKLRLLCSNLTLQK